MSEEELKFLFESPLYTVDEFLYQKTRDPEWVTAVLKHCESTTPREWNALHLVAIAQYSCAQTFQRARALLADYVQFYSEE